MTNERTPKPLKAVQLIGLIMLFLGVAVRAGAGEYWGSFMAFTGFSIWVIGKTLAWWHNG